MARPSLFSNKKFAKLSRLLGSSYKAVGILETLWHRAYMDGEDVIGNAEDVEFIIGWDGEAGACAAALVESCFFDLLDNGDLRVHDLFDHAPDYVRKRRTRELERRSVTSQRPVSDRSVSDNGRSVSDNDRPPAPAPAPAPKKKKSKKKKPDQASPVSPGGTGAESRKENSRTIFLPPSLDDVRAYIAEKGYHFKAEAFIAFYESKGWKIGKNKMKSWKSACSTWEIRWKEDNPKGEDDYYLKLAKKFNCLPSDVESFFKAKGYTPNSEEEIYEWLKAT